jgi:hypothetical protein
MADNNILKINCEEAYFQEEAMKQLQKLREDAKKEANQEYCDSHKGHCFRCGTRSLAEVKQGDIHIDICINKDCGAVHLDPGELEKLLEAEKTVFGKIKTSVFSVFK